MTIRLTIAWGEASEKVLMRMAAFSAVAHVVALIVFSILPRFITPAPPPRATIAEIIPASALLPRAPRGGSPVRPAGPTPSQRAEQAREAAKQSARPRQKAEDPTVPPLEKKETPRRQKIPPKPAPEPRQPEDRPEPEEEPETGNGDAAEAPPRAEPGSGAPGQGISFGGASGPGGIPSIGSSAFPFDYYRSSLVAILQSNWRRPVAPEGLSATSSCRIQFTILKSGIVQDPKIVAPSGNAALDQSALRAVYDSNPLPPLPFQYGHTSVSAEVVFELTPD